MTHEPHRRTVTISFIRDEDDPLHAARPWYPSVLAAVASLACLVLVGLRFGAAAALLAGVAGLLAGFAVARFAFHAGVLGALVHGTAQAPRKVLAMALEHLSRPVTGPEDFRRLWRAGDTQTPPSTEDYFPREPTSATLTTRTLFPSAGGVINTTPPAVHCPRCHRREFHLRGGACLACAYRAPGVDDPASGTFPEDDPCRECHEDSTHAVHCSVTARHARRGN